MLKRIYKIFLTLDATSLIIIIYMVNTDIYIPVLPYWLKYILFILIPVILTIIVLFCAKFLSKDSINSVIDIEQANNSFLPSYLGYFFVALSIDNLQTMVFIYIILFIFTYVSQTLYFNPMFLIFGYQFYYVTTENNIKIFLITKQELKSVEDAKFFNLKRINNFTYIELEEQDESFNS